MCESRIKILSPTPPLWVSNGHNLFTLMNPITTLSDSPGQFEKLKQEIIQPLLALGNCCPRQRCSARRPPGRRLQAVLLELWPLLWREWCFRPVLEREPEPEREPECCLRRPPDAWAWAPATLAPSRGPSSHPRLSQSVPAPHRAASPGTGRAHGGSHRGSIRTGCRRRRRRAPSGST